MSGRLIDMLCMMLVTVMRDLMPPYKIYIFDKLRSLSDHLATITAKNYYLNVLYLTYQIAAEKCVDCIGCAAAVYSAVHNYVSA